MDGAGKWISAPSLRPIQFRWISLIGSGQSRTSRSSIKRSAYAVIRIFHCFSGRLKTGKLPRSLRPSDVTSSFASTVPRPGHQFTGASSRYARRNESTTWRRSTESSFAQSRPSGAARAPDSKLSDQLVDGAGLLRLGVVPGVEDLQEDPLRPAVVGDVGGRDRPAGIVAQTEAVQLTPVVRDVRLGGDAGVLARLHGVLLGGQAERVEPHRVQDVVAGHAQVAGVDVGADEAQRVPDVQSVAARVGEHVEHEGLRLAPHRLEAVGQGPGRVRGEVGAVGVPLGLPAGLDLVRDAAVVPVRRNVGTDVRTGGHGGRGYWPTPAGPGLIRPSDS